MDEERQEVTELWGPWAQEPSCYVGGCHHHPHYKK